MTATLAILRFELRLLRRDVWIAALVFAAAIGLLLVGGVQGVGGSLSPLLRGSALCALVLLGLTRVALAQDAWTDLRLTLPVSGAQLALSGALLWGVFALLPACVYVLWVGSPPGVAFLHALNVWLWLMLAGTVAGLVLGARARTMWAGLNVALFVIGLVTLATTLDEVVEASATSTTALRLACMVVLTLLPGRLVAPELLPQQSPKDVRPRLGIIGGLRRRRSFARSPRQVLALLGVHRFGLSASSAVLLGYGVIFFVLVLTGERRFLGSVAGDVFTAVALVMGGGLYLSGALARATARWSFLRAYPLTRAAVWTRPLLLMIAITGVWLGAFVWLHHRAHPARIVHHFVGDEGPFARHGGWGGGAFPALAAPDWVRTDPVLAQRPKGMPLPRWGRWPLRPVWDAQDPDTKAFADVEEGGYYIEATRFYLQLVHGVQADDEDIALTLGEVCHLAGYNARIPEQHFFEHVASRGYGVFEMYGRHYAEGYVDVHVPAWRRKTVRPLQPLELYAFAPALDRLQALVEDQVARAAWLRTLLDACVVLFSLLLFVRLALIEGTLRFALPLLALLPLVLCFGGRATELWRNLRDAHLATPWLVPAVTLCLCVVLVVSVKRQLGHTTPSTVA